MALSEEEMIRWQRCFQKFDVYSNGYITMEIFFSAIEEYLSDYARDLFLSVDALNEEGNLEFGDFMRVIAIFCMFGLEEILKSIFAFADSDKTGYVTTKQYVDLITDINGGSNSAIRVWLLKKAPSPNDTMNYKKFKKNHESYPVLIYPIIMLQKKIRLKTLGKLWIICILAFGDVYLLIISHDYDFDLYGFGHIAVQKKNYLSNNHISITIHFHDEIYKTYRGINH